MTGLKLTSLQYVSSCTLDGPLKLGCCFGRTHAGLELEIRRTCLRRMLGRNNARSADIGFDRSEQFGHLCMDVSHHMDTWSSLSLMESSESRIWYAGAQSRPCDKSASVPGSEWESFFQVREDWYRLLYMSLILSGYVHTKC